MLAAILPTNNKLENFLADDQLSKAQVTDLINLAITIKKHPADYSQALAGKSIAMIFEKPSLRTHVSFDMGINKLGGHALYLGQQNGKLGERERVSDYAKNLSCYADLIVARVFENSAIEGLAKHATVPVINALCDIYHPCQALADFVTLQENFADLTKVKKVLGFKPKIDFKSGISKFTGWVKTQEIQEDKYSASIKKLKNKGLLK